VRKEMQNVYDKRENILFLDKEEGSILILLYEP
jgi:hypothetical protein